MNNRDSRSFVGENNPFSGRVVKADKTGAVVDTAFGQLRGRNPKGVKEGDKAILFVRPESLRLGKNGKDSTLSSTVLNVAFEGNASHIFLKGSGKKDITLTVGRLERVTIPGQGVAASVSYEPELGLVLPDGRMARE
jgi:spermidine/putrescine transport system ATP-binding protein